jgi:four helix bundle protein
MYKDLIAWQKSYKFALHIYEATKAFPKEEMFGIISQMRRASTSIPVNIAEGSVRQSDKELVHFLHIAQGSATEMEVWLEFSKDLGYMNEKTFTALNEECSEIGRIITGFIKSKQ